MTTFASARWLPIAFATAILAGTLAIVAVNVGDAANNSPSSLVPIVPCRLFDTRSDNQVGNRGQPIPADTSVTFAVWGTNGECTIPDTATAIATNVTIVNPTSSSFLTVYPADAPTRPKASNLNWLPTSPPTPNQVTVGLSANGAINVYNLAGSVDVIVDIVGYYVQAQIAAPTTTAPPTTTTTTTTTIKPLPRLIETTGTKQLFFGCGGCTTDFMLISVPTGRWLVTYTVTVVNFTGNSDLFRCWITTFIPGPVLGLTTSRVGPHADVAGFHGEAPVTVTTDQSQLYKMRCSHDSQIGSGPLEQQNAYLEFGTLTAVEVTT
jgi:hypothetical protein